MTVAASNDFFTYQSLATFGGCTVATVAVGNAASTLFKRDLKIVPFLLALGLSFLFASEGDSLSHPRGWIVALVNGCLVFCTAAGVQVTALVTVGGKEVGQHSKQAAQPGQRHPWLSSWVPPSS